MVVESSEYDEFGFQRPDGVDEWQAASLEYAQSFAPKARRRLMRFERLQQALPGGSDDWEVLPKSTAKAFLRKGVPPQHRSEVWWSVLGCEPRRARAPQAYWKYLEEPLAATVSEAIERDLRRTFPNHRKLQTSDGCAELRNILRAFAVHAPQIQYCQGLNFIAALMLVIFADEERAFWCLASAIENLGVQGYYSEGMTLLRADMRVLESVLLQVCPKLSKVFRDQNVELAWLCEEWYISWFAKSLPLQATLRVWDALFFEGYKVLFRVALGVFKMVEKDILSHPTFEEIMLNAKQWGHRQVAHNELIKASFSGIQWPLKRQHLLKAREAALNIIDSQDQERQQRKATTVSHKA